MWRVLSPVFVRYVESGFERLANDSLAFANPWLYYLVANPTAGDFMYEYLLERFRNCSNSDHPLFKGPPRANGYTLLLNYVAAMTRSWSTQARIEQVVIWYFLMCSCRWALNSSPVATAVNCSCSTPIRYVCCLCWIRR